ncbi:hypothetical protein pb186bvf_019388 [Paramecium bursaria]
MRLQYPKQRQMYNPEQPTILKNVVQRLYERDREKWKKIEIKQAEKENIVQTQSFMGKKSQILALKASSFFERQDQLLKNRNLKIQIAKLAQEEEPEPSLIRPSRSVDEFLKQNDQWQQERNKKIQKLRYEQEAKSMFSFKPTINQKSSQMQSQSVTERLYPKGFQLKRNL